MTVEELKALNLPIENTDARTALFVGAAIDWLIASQLIIPSYSIIRSFVLPL